MAAGMAVEEVVFDFEVDKDDYEAGIYVILSKLRPAWKKDQIQFKKIAQGIVNAMIICYITDDYNDAVIVRIFGNLLAGIVKREQEVKANRLLSRQGLGPPLLATFKNGQCSGYINGKSYSWSDAALFKDVEFVKKVAKTLAGFHCKKTSDLAREEYGIEKGTDFIAHAGTIVDKWPVPLPDKEMQEWFYAQTPSAELLKQEYAISRQVIEDVRLPDVLCHGDLNPTNIMYEGATDTVKLVDFECVGFNSPLSDLSIFLVTSAGGPMATDLDAVAHSTEFKGAFVRAYLEEIRRLDESPVCVSDEDVRRYCARLEKTTIALQYIGLLLAPTYFATNPNLKIDGMDFKALAKPMLNHWDYYMKNKERMLSIKVD